MPDFKLNILASSEEVIYQLVKMKNETIDSLNRTEEEKEILKRCLGYTIDYIEGYYDITKNDESFFVLMGPILFEEELYYQGIILVAHLYEILRLKKKQIILEMKEAQKNSSEL